MLIADIDDAGAEETVSMIRSNDGDGSYIRADVTKPADVRTMVQRAVDQCGGLDCAFNNVGFVGSGAGVVDTSEADWEQAWQ